MIALDQGKAVLQLLGDDDPTTVALVKEQLTGRGAGDLVKLRELLATTDSAQAAEQLREIIEVIEAREADRRFGRLCANFADDGDLETAAWELAATFLHGQDFSPQRAKLEAWGQEAVERLSRAGWRKEERVAVFTRFLGYDLRLRGNDDEYYLYSNSLLPRVIDTRFGIPISLALVYVLVGQRAGISIEGVGLPGHFLARHDDIIFDPFHGGRRVTLEECATLLAQQNLSLMPHHLAPTTPRQMLIRMLTNLRYIATNADPPLAEKLGGWEATLRGE
jgi:regulator of sirC expression with transglutaminase-like and TPR domain